MIVVVITYWHTPIGSQSWLTRRVYDGMSFCSRCLGVSTISFPKMTSTNLINYWCDTKIGSSQTVFTLHFSDETPSEFFEKFRAYVDCNPKYTFSCLTPTQTTVQCSHA